MQNKELYDIKVKLKYKYNKKKQEIIYKVE